jgi:dTDP-4-amino-4,6-dideoxygalactose transaminase
MTMIRMNDFSRDPEALRNAQKVAMETVLDSGWYVLGPAVEAFERRFAAICGAKYAVGVANGMDAIEIALRALNIGEGDEVITTPMTAFATVLAIYRAGAVPVLADIDAGTALLAIDSVKRCITPRTRAVLLVHLYGQMSHMDQWMQLCESAKIDLIEDCAQSHLASSNGRIAGTIGLCGAYSFYPTKNLGTAGDGGALITQSASVNEMARALRNYGQSERYHHPFLGLNSRLDEIHAAMLAERLEWLQRFTVRRRQIAAAYRAGLVNASIELLSAPQDIENHVYHLFVVRCQRRDDLSGHLKRCGVESLSHYPVPIHHQKSCLTIRKDPIGLPVTEVHAKTCLSIPCHHNLTDEQVGDVIGAMNSFS